jgi:hypothetical protein
MNQPEEPYFVLPGLRKRLPVTISNEELENIRCDNKLEISSAEARQRRDRVVNSFAKINKPKRADQFVQNNVPVFSS